VTETRLHPVKTQRFIAPQEPRFWLTDFLRA
jgi:hypothetical protein